MSCVTRVSKQKIEITIPANLKFSSLVRRISEDFFLHAGFTREWAGRLKLVVDELFMNAIRYGSRIEGGKIRMLYEFDEKETTFRIEDEGAGAKKLRASELKKLIHSNSSQVGDVTKTSGRGLALISSLWTDSMEVEDTVEGGIAVTFTKMILNSAPPAPSPSLKTLIGAEMIVEQGATVSPVIPKGPTEVIKISGEVDQSNLDAKTQLISDVLKRLPPESTLVLDCEKLVYINSTFIGHLAAWLNDIQSKNGQLVLRHTGKQVREVLDLVGLSKVLFMES